MENYSIITQYTQQQVVLNFYEEGCLEGREGFFFDYIQIDNNKITFVKKDNSLYQLKLDVYDSFTP